MGEFEESLTIETLPLWAPPTEGAKSTINVAVPPGGKVSGRKMPLMLKSVPGVTFAWVTTTVAAPELVMVTPRESN